MGGLSITHWIVAVVVVLIVFGPDRLPQLAKALGKSIREIKDGISGGAQEPRSPSIEVKSEPSQLGPSPNGLPQQPLEEMASVPSVQTVEQQTEYPSYK